jgi:hypothetical protein
LLAVTVLFLKNGSHDDDARCVLLGATKRDALVFSEDVDVKLVTGDWRRVTGGRGWVTEGGGWVTGGWRRVTGD